MSGAGMWYLCGIGSNIDPERNLPAAVVELVARFGPVSLSAVIRTAPRGMESDRWFLNALAVFHCELPPDRVKARLNRLEESMGRDRSDPLSAIRDRPIDIDILEVRQRPAFTGEQVTEDYYHQLLADQPADPQRVWLQGQPLGQAPATIHRDQGAGHKMVVHQGQNLLYDAVKAALPG